MSKKPRNHIDMKEKTASIAGTLYFLSGQFADGHLLGFYSQNPCSCVRDQDTGWAVIDRKTKMVVTDCATRTYGFSPSLDWRGWMKQQREKHGKIKYFLDESGRRVWAMTRDY